MIKAFSLLFLLLVVISCMPAQEIIYEHYADTVDFWMVIPYNTLNFKKGLEKTDYQLSMQIYNTHKKMVCHFEKLISVPKRNWLADTGIPVRFSQILGKGTYNVQYQLKNKSLGDKREYKRSFEIGSLDTEIGMSWIIAKRENVEFIPNKLSELEADEVIWQQRYSITLDSIRVKIDNQKITLNNPQSPIQLDLKAYLLPSATNQTNVIFYEKNIHYVMEPFLFSPWYSYGLRYPLEEQLAQLRYIASQNEWQVLSKTPKNKHSESIEGFWKNLDPSPGTIRNETREKFYQRVLKADELFTIHKKLKGWSSDRGRIYIKYGEPDDIYTDFYTLGTYPHIVWSYYKEDRKFIFADTKGYGQYILRNKDEEY